MLGRIYAFALNTFREAIRKRFLIAIAILVVGTNMFAAVLGQMSLHEEARVARDVGLWSISFFGSMTAIILGVLLLYSEIQKRTIHTMLSKPVERYEFVLGKYLGMAFTLGLLVAVFTLAMASILFLRELEITDTMFKAVVLSYIEVMVVAAIAILFSSFSSPVLSGVLTGSLWFIGHRTPELVRIIDSAELGLFRVVARGTLFVVPDLHAFAISGSTVDGEHVSVHSSFVGWDYVMTAVGHGLFYIGLFLVLAIAIFSRRDFS
ncbi:MAG: ABC transporter permease [Proteobacteria bacterium]|nr:ABC transporter permease [Pseudomonadota bacterium]